MEQTNLARLRESAAMADEAVWTGAHQNDLPDDAFAYIEPGGKKDETGRTVPRSLRHLPYKNAAGKIDPAHVRDALQRLDQTDIPADAKASAYRKLIAAAKSVGVEVSDKKDAKESAFAPSALGKTKVATLTTTWLEDGAVSLNGRQYPRETVDRLIQSAQIHLSTPGAAPLTCYISHEAADRDDSLKLAGKITQVWREGSKAKARIDLVNTEAGRTMATQAAGGFLRTMSLRASNAEIQRPKDSTWPVVGGSSLRLDGIDFTASPGINVAKIEDVALAENAREGPQRLHEVFNAHAPLLQLEQKESAMNRLTEADGGGNMVGGSPPTSGDSPSVDGTQTQDAYGQRQYKAPDMTSGPMAGADAAPELQEAHDRIAMVQGRSCAPGRESKAWRKALRGMTEAEQRATVFLWQLLEAGRIREAGRALSKRNDGHLDVAHDSLARHMALECMGESSKPGGGRYDPDGDGDDDSTNDPQKNPDFALDKLQAGDDQMESARRTKGGDSPMTEEEALKLLEAKGYGIQRPKSAEETLREQLEAMKAEQEAKLAAIKEQQERELAELKATLDQNTPNPERRSFVSGANTNTQTRQNRPLHGNYLQERIRSLDWNQLADRTAPLPDDIPVEILLKEFERLYAVTYDDWAERVHGIRPIYAQ